MDTARITVTLGVHRSGKAYLTALEDIGITVSPFVRAVFLDPSFTTEPEPTEKELVSVMFKELSIDSAIGRFMNPIIDAAKTKNLRPCTAETAAALLLRPNLPGINHTFIGMKPVVTSDGFRYTLSVFHRTPITDTATGFRSVNVIWENPKTVWHPSDSFLFRV